MTTETHLAELRPRLKHRATLIATGRTGKTLTKAVEQDSLVRLFRGWYVDGEEWRALNARDQHLVRVLAVHSNSKSRLVFSHASAAALHGLPLLNADLQQVHTTTSPEVCRARSRAASRHRTELTPDAVEEVAGLRCTELLRTAVDVARTARFETGVICGDAAMRRLRGERDLDADDLRSEMNILLDELPRSAGHAHARRVIAFLSDLAESPLESLSRLQLARLGFRVDEQVEVAGPRGTRFRLDFEILGFDTFAEVDGDKKYLDPTMMEGRSAAEILLREKKRETWISGQERKHVIRWDWHTAWSLDRLASTLRAFGLEPPRRIPDTKLY